MNCSKFRLLLIALALAAGPDAGLASGGIRSVALDEASFNPSIGEELRISYQLPDDDQVTLQVYDSDGGLVRTLVDGQPRKAGRRSEVWDGLDVDGEVVPNEAYLFTLETASGQVYDPTTFSGGIVGDLTEVDFDPATGTMTYRLPAAARVLVRLGVTNGPMLKTLVDWQPRPVGLVTEYWDGKDENDLFDLASDRGFSALITYVTLPSTTVITYGNRDETYRAVKLGRAADRPQKPERPPSDELASRLRPTGLVPPAWARAPQVSVEFPQNPELDVPTVADEVTVRVDVDPSDREALARDQFEILFFVDNVFFAEAERGYLPYTWRWELLQIPHGEHILTVNVSSFRGQVGVASRKVQVTESKE